MTPCAVVRTRSLLSHGFHSIPMLPPPPIRPPSHEHTRPPRPLPQLSGGGRGPGAVWWARRARDKDCAIFSISRRVRCKYITIIWMCIKVICTYYLVVVLPTAQPPHRPVPPRSLGVGGWADAYRTSPASDPTLVHFHMVFSLFLSLSFFL